MLHPRVLFIGDRPNPAHNVHIDVPFVGTTSYKTILEWIYKMDIDIRQVSMVNAYDVRGNPNLYGPMMDEVRISKYKVVLLGVNAEEAFRHATRNLIGPIPAFKMPHPSDLSDKKMLTELLVRCKQFIYKV